MSKESQLQTEIFSLLFDNKIFASVYKDCLLMVLKKIANRGETKVPDEEKVVVMPLIVNELTEMTPYSSER